jgi:hypothetical protein
VSEKCPSIFYDYLEGLFPILSFLAFPGLANFPKPHLSSPKQDILEIIMFCHDEGLCQIPRFFSLQENGVVV